MGTKKIQLTFELTTEKEWREFIQRPGLIVVDLYRDWAGPCVAMTTPLKTLKTSELAYDWMHLASAPSSIVPDLKRLEGSRPTFVLLSGQRLVNVIFGCKAPEVIRIITEEINREKRAAEGLEKRKTVSLTRLSPAEVAREEHLLGSEGDRLRAERTQAEMEADRILRHILTQIADNLPATTVVVVFPYALQSDSCEEILGTLRESWTEMGFSVTREEHVELNREAVDLMFWERRLPQHDVLVESVTAGASLVLMLERLVVAEETEEAVDEEETYVMDVEPAIAKSIYGFLPGTGSSMELITPVESVTPGLGEEGDFELFPEDEVEEDKEEVAEGDGEGDGEEDGEEGEEEAAADAPQEPDEEEAAEDDAKEEKTDEGEQDDGLKTTMTLDQEEAGEDAGEDAGEVGEVREVADDEGGAEAEEDEDGEAEDEAKSTSPPEVQQEDDEDDEDDDLIPQAPVRVWNPRELLPALDSAAARLLFRQDQKGPVLPGIWAPLTALSKAAAVKALFEDVAEPLYKPPTPPPPPPPASTVICFAGDKRDEVLELSGNFPSEVTRFGFFTKGRKLLASSRVDYEKLVRGGLQTAKTLVVLEVTRVRSAPLLELATAGPLYISATPKIAKADVDEFFGSKVARAGQDDLREIVKVHEEKVEEAAPATVETKAKAKAPTKLKNEDEDEDEDEDEGGEREGEEDGEGGEQLEDEGVEGAEVLQVQQEVPTELGDGEAVPESIPEADGGIDGDVEAAVEATAADVAAEEQLLSGTGEGDAPPAPAPAAEGRTSLVGDQGEAPSAEE